MHELTIVKGIVDAALRHGREAGATRISAVRVKVGEFTAVDPDCLQHYFRVLTEATEAEGAELAVERVPLTASCSACSSPFTPDTMVFRCPACGSPEIEITGGRELCVDTIEVE